MVAVCIFRFHFCLERVYQLQEEDVARIFFRHFCHVEQYFAIGTKKLEHYFAVVSCNDLDGNIYHTLIIWRTIAVTSSFKRYVCD